MKVFLSAEWHNLINLTYRVPAEKLEPLLPKGVELDLYEGHAHLSLVAFDFINTRVKGMKIPFHVDFPEINLRYYVRAGRHRGVVFVKELVPKHCIAFVAKRFYNEPYESQPMESGHETDGDGKLKSHHSLWVDSQEHTIDTVASAETQIPGSDTAAHFFKEHDLGFGINKNGETLCYEVSHPVWETRELLDVKLNFDFAKVYGEEWAFLNGLEPQFPLFAVGSAIKVYHPLSLENWLETRGAEQDALLAKAVAD
ncbi:MAG: DUF2071 domain-containing protein [Bacteroidia bacterium]|nr:DUF2071 domain-containing protein [Bacteroidia bacterium]